MSSTLALHGGDRTVPEGMVQKWPPIDDTDRKAVLDSLEQPNHAFGPHCDLFQQRWAQWNGNRHAIFTNSGTAALHMGLVGCGIGAGDHVLVTAYSWSASATCILHHNAIPIFVDIDFDTMNIDPAKIEAAITPRTKAIVVVHLHGLAADMGAILPLARKHNLRVIEDACQAHGATFEGQKVGTFGDCGAFSFNQNKSLCTGEGGMFVSNDDTVREGAVKLWNFGETRTPLESRDYHAYALGWMYRGSDLVAAFGTSQLAKLDRYLDTCRENALTLHRALDGLEKYGYLRPEEPAGRGHTFYNFTSRIDMQRVGWTGDPKLMRNAVMKALNAEGVPVSVWQRFILPAMTVFQAKNAYGGGFPWSIPGADEGVDYDPERFPEALRHSETHFGLTTPLRAPNGSDVALKVAEAFEKVFTNLDKIDPDEVANT